MARRPVAPQLLALLESALGQAPGSIALRFRAWDGSEAGPADAPVVAVRTPRALRRLLWAPSELGLARAYVSGDLDVEGDLFAAIGAYAGATAGRSPTEGQGQRRWDIVTTALRLRVLGRPPAPPAEEVRPLRGRRHTKGRDHQAVSHHYDVGNDFYRLVLGPSLVYSCAYWARPGDPSYTLEDAQRDKLELVCRKLGLHEPGPTRRLLDVGCGWGSMVLHAARQHDVRAVGVTLSEEQAQAAQQRVKEAGLDDRVEIRLQDYRDVDDGPYDAISSIGMAEHVGTASYPTYARQLHGLLREGGRLLNHQIAARPGKWVDAPSFTGRYVFPDGELVPVGETVRLLEEAGFEVRDVEALREHYGRTLRAWVANLEAGWEEAAWLTSPPRARVWRLYMAGSALGFETNRLGVHQVLAVRPTAVGRSLLPGTRREWLGPDWEASA